MALIIRCFVRECVTFTKNLGLPVLVLGGGGYTPRNVARCWAYETGLLVDMDMPTEIPYSTGTTYRSPTAQVLQPPYSTGTTSALQHRYYRRPTAQIPQAPYNTSTTGAPQHRNCRHPTAQVLQAPYRTGTADALQFTNCKRHTVQVLQEPYMRCIKGTLEHRFYRCPTAQVLPLLRDVSTPTEDMPGQYLGRWDFFLLCPL